MSNISDLLNGETSQETTPEVEATVEETTVETAESNDETQKTSDDTTGLESAELPSAEALQQQLEAKDKELNAYKVKARDEKSKRQKLEKRELPDVLDDQEGFVSEMESATHQTLSNALANQSEFYVRREFGEDKVNDALLYYDKLVEQNPALAAEVQSSVSPWHAMMDVVDKAQKFEQINNPNYEADLEAKIEAKVRAKIEAEAKAKAEKTSAITTNLAKEGSGSINDASWTGPTPLSKLLTS